jgi:hypothetical protein
MQKTVTLLKWEPKRDFYTDNLVCWVKFSVIDSTLIGTPRERESVHCIKVVMTDMLLDTWRIPGAIDFGITNDMVKVALQSLEDYLAERLKSGPLAAGELSPLLMTTENSPKRCPYKIANIHYPNKAFFAVEIENQPAPPDTLSMHPKNIALERRNLAKLHNLLTARFNEGELRTLCFSLGIDYENLLGGGKADKARELIAYCERHGEISDLMDVIEHSRPDVLADAGTREAFQQSERGHHYIPAAGQDANLLLQIWDSLDSDLQDALSLAYNQARREGKDTIQTRYFFAAIARLMPEPLPELMSFLPRDILPPPTNEHTTTERILLIENPQLSGCIADSLVNLGQVGTPENKISSVDVFVDVAKHGTGSSVTQLRRHGVTPERIDDIVKQIDWHGIER